MKPAQSFADLPALANHLRGELENKKSSCSMPTTAPARHGYPWHSRTWANRTRPAIPCISTPSPKIYSTGTTIWRAMKIDACCSTRIRVFPRPVRVRNGQPHPPIAAALRGFRLPYRYRGPRMGGALSRTVDGRTVDNIKVSRGEENIFIWCFSPPWLNWRWTPISRRTSGEVPVYRRPNLVAG